jgi:HlyD family secretion protein
MGTVKNWSYVWLAVLAAAGAIGSPRIAVSADGPKPAVSISAASRTATATRDDRATTVNAVGTVEPEEVVDVGSQVNGIIQSFGADPHTPGKSIDYGSQVEEGTLLAKIDDTLYVAQVEKDRANCMCADAELRLAKANLALAKANWQRDQILIKSNAIPASDLDVAKCACEQAEASVAVAEAHSAQTKTALKQAEINLGLTSIRSPVKGVVIARRVNRGQTVVDSLSASSLFLIATDLKQLQVWVSVNEADIGKIHEKQTARFTVDAYPGKVFEGKVTQIRLNATMLQNAVTYTVVVATDNSSAVLLPYMTAKVQFEAGHGKN